MADDDKKKKTAADEATARARADFAAAAKAPEPKQKPAEGPAMREAARRIDLAREIYVNSFAGGKPTSPDVALVRADEFIAKTDEVRGAALIADARSA